MSSTASAGRKGSSKSKGTGVATVPFTPTTHRPADVHAFAWWLAQRGERFSLADQKWAFNVLSGVLYASGIIGFIIGFINKSFLYTSISVAVGAVVCLVLLLPNWRRTPDQAASYVPDEVTAEYYAVLTQVRAAVTGKKQEALREAAPKDD